MSRSRFLVVVLYSLLSHVLYLAAEEVSLFAQSFDVEPGGHRNTFKGEADGMTCEFSYVCQGGTLEEWVMNIDKDSSGYYTCEVERPEGHSHSYLYFEEFELKVTGGVVQEGIIFSADGHTAGDESEYLVTKHTIENTDEFKNKLNRVYAIISRKKHHEL